MQEIDKKFLFDYLNAYSPVSQEVEGQKVWADYVKEFADELHDDNYGNVWAVLKSKNPDAKKVVIEAHADEISFMVSNITSDGFLHVVKNGGSDPLIAPSKRVVVHTRKNGKVPGYFGHIAIHLRKAEDKVTLKNITVDLGVDSKEKVKELGVEVGNIITFNDQLEEIGNYYVGKSLDNKIGGFVIARTLKRLKESGVELPFDLYVVNAIQEEVGLHGAKIIAQTIKPDLALVIDVCHNTNTPGIDKNENGDVKGGDGPALESTAQNHRGFNEFIRKIAEEKEIKYQVTIGSFGNDTMGFFLNGGAVTAILGLPLKYMHSTVESAHKDDVESTIDLYYNVLTNLPPDLNFKYHNF